MIAEKPTVKTSWLFKEKKKYGDSKPEEKAAGGGSNEFCIDKGIGYEWQGEVMHFHWD